MNPSTLPVECPVRPGDCCRLCHPGASGPENCGLVYLVFTDPDLRAQLLRMRAEQERDGGEADPVS